MKNTLSNDALVDIEKKELLIKTQKDKAVTIIESTQAHSNYITLT